MYLYIANAYVAMYVYFNNQYIQHQRTGPACIQLPTNYLKV